MTPLPKPGTDVHLVLINRGPDKETRPTFVLDATVVDTFDFITDKGTFCVVVPDSEVPERSIRMANVVSIGSELVQGWSEHTQAAKTWQVESNSTRGEFYTVTQDGTNWSCTCRGFGFHRTCTHIKHIKSQPQ